MERIRRFSELFLCLIAGELLDSLGVSVRVVEIRGKLSALIPNRGRKAVEQGRQESRGESSVGVDGEFTSDSSIGGCAVRSGLSQGFEESISITRFFERIVVVLCI